MAKQTINIGASANDGNGDPLRVAFDKINDNFDELYAVEHDLSAIDQSIVPDTDNTYDLGSADKQWRSLYVSSDTIFIGGVSLRIDGEGRLIVGDDSTVLGGAVSYNDLTDTPTIQSFNQDLNTTDSVTFNTVTTPNLVLDGDVTTLNELFIDGGAQAIGIKSQINIVVDGDVTFQNGNITGLTGNLDGDVTGSVFADDSTLLVDGVNGSIPYSVISNVQVTESDLLVDFAAIVATQIQTNGLPINTTATGTLTVNGQFTVEESFSSTPTTKFFEIETGAGNNRLLRTGVNMSAFAQNIGPEIDLTSYRSSPQDGNAGPGFVLRASTLTSVNDVIATIVTEVTDVSAGNVTSKILFATKHNGSYVTPLTITGTTVDMQTANQVSISNENGAVDIYGEVEFNNGTTSFQAGNSVDFNCPVDFSGEVKFTKTTTTGDDDNPTLTLIDVNSSSVQVLTSNSTSTNNWELPDGSEGQIMHFVAGGGGGLGANHKIKINNWWKRDADTGGWSSVTGYWDVFAIYGFAGRADTGMATAIFVDGAWRTTSPWVD